MLRDILNPADAIASKRIDASTLLNASTRGGGTRRSESGAAAHATGTLRTDVNACARLN